MSELLDMGKHASFIWLSYGVTLVAIIILGAVSWRRHVRLRQMISDIKDKKNKDKKES